MDELVEGWAGSAEVDPVLVEAALGFVNDEDRNSTMDAWLKIGDRLIRLFFGGDVEAANGPGAARHESYRACIKDKRVTADRRRLRHATLLVRQFNELSEEVPPYALSYSHHLHLMRVPERSDRRLLAKEAVASEWTAKRLGQVVKAQLDATPTVDPALLRVRSLVGALDACTLEILESLPKDIADAEVDAVRVASRAMVARVKAYHEGRKGRRDA